MRYSLRLPLFAPFINNKEIHITENSNHEYQLRNELKKELKVAREI
jgi:hypothetical protein